MSSLFKLLISNASFISFSSFEAFNTIDNAVDILNGDMNTFSPILNNYKICCKVFIPYEIKCNLKLLFKSIYLELV
jgi:hypothetical protein